MISLQNVSKKFDSLSVLRHVNLEIQPGEFLTILGPSGCGKSTLLRLLAGLEKPTEGELVRPKNNLNFSFVFQDSELLPWRNIEENILLPLELTLKKESSGQLEDILSLVKLSSFKKYYPHQLSGGMKMRVSIARALMTNPSLLLMDEPFSSLDENTRFEMQDQLLHLQKTKKISIVFVTHSISEAVYLSDKVQVFSSREGCSIFEQKILFDGKRNDEIRLSGTYNNYVTMLSQKMKQAVIPFQTGDANALPS
ncbi:MAG: ABC transporter ATP-binding protein [Bdellovibrionota bacterium]